MTPEEKITQLGLVLPPVAKPAGLYQPVVITGRMAYLSGQLSKDADGKILAGKVGKELTQEQGREAARLAALNALAVMEHLIGFDRILRMVKMTGFIQAAQDFYEIPAVLNGASELFGQVLGDRGVHARSAVGAAGLPMNAAVELELILELK